MAYYPPPIPVKNLSTHVPVNVAFANAAYATGSCFGGKITLPSVSRANGLSVWLNMGQLILPLASVLPAMELYVFEEDPTASTIVDQAAFSVASADYDKQESVGLITTWRNIGTAQVGSIFWDGSSLPHPTPNSSSQSLFAALVNRGASFTPASSVTARLEIEVIQE